MTSERVAMARLQVTAARTALDRLERQTEDARQRYRAALTDLSRAEYADRVRPKTPDPRHHRTDPK